MKRAIVFAMVASAMAAGVAAGFGGGGGGFGGAGGRGGNRGPSFQSLPPMTRPSNWFNDRTGYPAAYTTDAKKMPLVSVKGNKFVDPDGKTILFRGIDISDPDKLDLQGHWNRDYFAHVKDMGAMLVRIPVHPTGWRERGASDYLKLLDQAVGWCTEMNMYVILDWHSIGNLGEEKLQDPMYQTTKYETYNFFDTIARHYAGHNSVPFFELFNEPAIDKPGQQDRFGTMAWDDWRKMLEEEIALIRARDPQAIPLVTGFDWAYDLKPVKENPIRAEGIGYTVHPYANKRPKAQWVTGWEEDFGFVADKYPMIATEFGGFAAPPATQPADGAAMPASAPASAPAAGPGAGRGRGRGFGGGFGAGGADADYGPQIIGYLEKKGISYTLWCYDPEWGPSLLSNWNFDLNPSGQFAKAALHQWALK